MSDDEQIAGGGVGNDDIFDSTPTKQERDAMRKSNRPPSEWLRLLCKDWANENEHLVETADAKFLDYKPYLKGLLTPQLLYRLSTPTLKESMDGTVTQSSNDIWGILGIDDDFDKSYIIAQVERFSSHFNIRGAFNDDESQFPHGVSLPDTASLAAAAAVGISLSPGSFSMHNFDAGAAAAAAAAALPVDIRRVTSKPIFEDSGSRRVTKEKETDETQYVRRQPHRQDEKHESSITRERKARERELAVVHKAAERESREAEREARRQKKLQLREQREKFAQQQKEAALKRAAELVASNRVPIEITRGSQGAKTMFPGDRSHFQSDDHSKKARSAIVVSTAADLHAIVTHSKALWAKYNAIAKEHNQKVNWIIVAKELGMHVKVREKYARMHSRAEQRGFDWVVNGDLKIKDHPEIFLEPTIAEQNAKMPLPPLHSTQTVLIENNKEVSDEAVALAAAVVDASVTAPPVDTVTQQNGTAAAIAATSLIADVDAANGMSMNEAQV